MKHCNGFIHTIKFWYILFHNKTTYLSSFYVVVGSMNLPSKIEKGNFFIISHLITFSDCFGVDISRLRKKSIIKTIFTTNYKISPRNSRDTVYFQTLSFITSP